LQYNNSNLLLIDKIYILLDIAKGIEKLHDNNIIHMNICKESIIKVGDNFKISSLKQSINLNLKKKNKFQIFSNHKYSLKSPELLYQDFNNIKKSVDIWNFGVLLFEVLTNTDIESITT